MCPDRLPDGWGCILGEKTVIEPIEKLRHAETLNCLNRATYCSVDVSVCDNAAIDVNEATNAVA